MKLLAKHKEMWEKKTVERPEISLVLRSHWNQPQNRPQCWFSLQLYFSCSLCWLHSCSLHTDFPHMEGNINMTSQKTSHPIASISRKGELAPASVRKKPRGSYFNDPTRFKCLPINPSTCLKEQVFLLHPQDRVRKRSSTKSRRLFFQKEGGRYSEK